MRKMSSTKNSQPEKKTSIPRSAGEKIYEWRNKSSPGKEMSPLQKVARKRNYGKYQMRRLIYKRLPVPNSCTESERALIVFAEKLMQKAYTSVLNNWDKENSKFGIKSKKQ